LVISLDLGDYSMAYRARGWDIFLLFVCFSGMHHVLKCHQKGFLVKEEQKQLTVFVHGTLFSPYAWLVHWIDCPLGWCPAKVQGNKYVVGRIPYILHQAAPREFSLDTFYLFGWSGELCLKARRKAAEELYRELKKYKGPITLIGQSHGCNVALNVALIAQEHNDTDFVIDRLILLAGPVQQFNAHCIASPIFKRVFSLYSSEDLLQILDPQGWYDEAKKIPNKKVPLFSERTFAPTPNLIQARILLHGRSPSHMDFILKPFIQKLPAIIHLLEDAAQHGQFKEDAHCIVDVPTNKNPYILKEKTSDKKDRLLVPRKGKKLFCKL
jgi:pimeloyl-ACP methyl ester carboxylesterase